MRTLVDAATRYAPLRPEVIDAALRELPDWRCSGNRLVRTVRTRDLWALLEQVVAVEEELDHHTDVTLDGGTVTFTLWTHVRDAVTLVDLELARRLDAVAADLAVPTRPM